MSKNRFAKDKPLDNNMFQKIKQNMVDKDNEQFDEYHKLSNNQRKTVEVESQLSIYF